MPARPPETTDEVQAYAELVTIAQGGGLLTRHDVYGDTSIGLPSEIIGMGRTYNEKLGLPRWWRAHAACLRTQVAFLDPFVEANEPMLQVSQRLAWRTRQGHHSVEGVLGYTGSAVGHRLLQQVLTDPMTLRISSANSLQAGHIASEAALGPTLRVIHDYPGHPGEIARLEHNLAIDERLPIPSNAPKDSKSRHTGSLAAITSRHADKLPLILSSEAGMRTLPYGLVARTLRAALVCVK